MTDAVIICPLRHEARALGRAGIVVADVTGPGTDGIARWAVDAPPPRGATVVLAGLAGGLDPERRAGTAWVAREIVALDGRTWPPPLVPDDAPTARVLAASGPLIDPDARRRARAAHGADLVDTESGAFAEAAVRAGWRWAVVRGISDDAGATLPDGVESWVDARGATRTGRVLLHMARRPRDVVRAVRLQRDSARALRAVAALVERLR